MQETERTPPVMEVIEEEEIEEPYVSFPPYKPKISFPQRFALEKIETQFRKFMELLKKVIH